MFFLNVLLAIVTFVAYVLPYLAPKRFPFLAVLTLIMPLFFILNALFFIYWAVQLKRRLILSGIVLLIGITLINKFYKLPQDKNSEEKLTQTTTRLTIMSYNVRLFNLFRWIKNETTGNEILSFINTENPEILAIQEYSGNAGVDLKVYPYKYVFTEGKQIKTAQAIFSKYPILEQNTISFPNSDNSAIYVDIKKGKDIIRVYNIHLQSIKISPEVAKISNNIETINTSKSQQLFSRISKAFAEQQKQAEILKEHIKKCNYPKIICGDMNNSAFSYVYRIIKADSKDAFEEAGSGFGKTYNFKLYPARIDYIFADATMQILHFKNYPDVAFSDHYPIMAEIAIE